MDTNALASFQAFVEAEARKPLASVRLTSGRRMQSQFVAGQQAAENLLNKALRALQNEDPERAEKFIQRSLGLPYDEHEEVLPAAHAVHMMLFEDLSEWLEADEDEDAEWLNQAMNILPVCGPLAQVDLLTCLASIRQDEGVNGHDLQPDERRLIDSALRGRTDISTVEGPAPDDPKIYVREVLEAVRLYGWR